MKHISKISALFQFFLIITFLTFASATLILASGPADSTKTHKHDMQMHGRMKTESDKKEKTVMPGKTKEESIVRKGTIDVKAIDKNKDGKVFQDQMDWNVISDKAGKCPLCKMTLEEVTVNKAKENLKKNGFKIK